MLTVALLLDQLRVQALPHLQRVLLMWLVKDFALRRRLIKAYMVTWEHRLLTLRLLYHHGICIRLGHVDLIGTALGSIIILQ